MKQFFKILLSLLLVIGFGHLGFSQRAFSSFTCGQTASNNGSNITSTANNQVICITAGNFGGTITINHTGVQVVVSPNTTFRSNATFQKWGGNATIFNYGTWERSLGSWELDRFENYGTVNIGSSTFALDGASDSYAQFSSNGSTPSFTGRLSISNGASVNIQSGSMSITSDVSFQGGTYTFATGTTIGVNGTLEFHSGTFTNRGAITVTNGTVRVPNSSTVVDNFGSLTIATADRDLDISTGGRLNNSGTISVPNNATIILNGTLNNNATGIITVAGRTNGNTDPTINIPGGGILINSGTATFNGPATIDNDFTNNAGGSLTFSGNVNGSSGNFTGINNGTLTLANSANFNVGGSFTNGTSGIVSVTGNTTVNGGGNFTNDGSYITNGNFTNGGTVSTGTNSVTRVGGNYTQTGNTSLTNRGIFDVTGNIDSQYATITTSGTITAGNNFRLEGGSVTNINNSTCAAVCGTSSITLVNGGTINNGIALCRAPSGSGNNGTVVNAPTTQSGGLGLTRSGSIVTGTFTPATDGNSYLILMQQGSAVSTSPKSFINYAVGDMIGSARVMAVVNGRTTTSFTTDISTFCGALHFAVFTMNVPVNDNCGRITYNISNPNRSSLTVGAVGGTISGMRPVCPNNLASTPTVTLTGFIGNVVRWESNSSNGQGNGNWSTVANSEGLTSLKLPAVSSETRFRAVVTCPSGGTVNSAEAILTLAAARTNWMGINANWNDVQNWCGALPTASDDVTIPSTVAFMPTVNLNGAVCNNLTLNGNLTMAANSQITVSGNLTINSGITVTGVANSNIIVNGTVTNNGTINATGGTFTYAGNTAKTIAPGNYWNLTASGTGVKTFSSAGLVRIQGVLNINGSLVTTGSTICFDGSANQTIPATNYNNLICRNSEKTISGNIRVGGNLEVSQSARINLNSRQLEISGTVSANGSSFKSDANAEISITGNGVLGGSILFDESFKQIGRLTINRTNLPTVTLASDLQVTNELILNNSSLNTGNFTLDLGTTGKITGETPNNFVRGNVRSTKVLAANTGSDFGSIGYEIAAGPENLGTVTITRTIGTAPVFNITNVPNSIFRGWTVNITGAQPSSGRRITLTWYAAEDNGLNLGQFNVYRRNTPSSPWETILPKSSDFSQNGNVRTVTVETNHFSDYGVGPGNDPLPVKLAYFKAQAVGEKVELVWSTINEVNNQEFVIERSIDGVNYEKITTIAGAGNSSTAKRYNFTDKPGMGAFYYRLTQIDFDGKFEVFPAVTVNLTGATLMPRLTILPNPCTDRAALSFIYQARKEYNIIVTDMQGKEMLNKIVVPRQQEVVQDIDVNWLPAGTYLVNIVSEDGTVAARMIKK